jgi:hypothetical protein
MTLAGGRLIDWRQEFAPLQEYFEERGGVVHILASDAGPTSSFAKAVRMRLEAGLWRRPWASVQIDGSNPNTHYMEDIVLQLESSLGVQDLGRQSAPSGGVSVGTDIEAHAVEIRDVSISIDDDPFLRAERSRARVDRVADAVRDTSSERRVALVFLHSHTHDPGALSRFRRMVWDQALAELTQVGLLLIDIGDPAQRGGEDWPPDPDLVIDLPAQYDQASTADARDDLAEIVLSEGLFATREEATAFGATLLASSNDVREVHARLAGTLARLSIHGRT